MGNYGFRISKDGSDVKTCDDKDCVVTSKYPVLKGSVSGNGTITPRIGNTLIGSVDYTTDTFTCNAHGLSNGDRVYFTTYDTLPSPIVGGSPSDPEGQTYFIVQKATNTFKVSTTSGGSPVNLTNNGSGTMYVNPYVLVEVSHDLGYVPMFKAFINPTDSVDLANVYYQMPVFVDDMTDHLYTYAYADTSKLYFRLEQWNTESGTYGDARNYNYRYFLFLDKAKV